MNHHRGRALAACAALLIACATARADDPAPHAGRFVAGMSLGDARAAAPDVEWRDGQVSPFSKKVLSIVGAGADSLGGLPHDVEIAPGYYGGYALRLRRSGPVADGAECEAEAVAVIAELEGRYGAFEAHDPAPRAPTAGLPRWQSQRLPGGALVVTPVPGSGTPAQNPGSVRIRAGESSAILFAGDPPVGKKNKREPTLRYGHSAHDTGDLALAMYFESVYSSNPDARTCELLTVIDRQPTTPEPQTIAFDETLVTRRPTIAERHRSLEGLDLPAARIEVPLECEIERGFGRLRCRTGGLDAALAPYADAALGLAARTVLDTTTLDPDDPAALRTTLRIAIDPSDRRPLNFVAAPRTAMNTVPWRFRPRRSELEQLYPTALLAKGYGKRVTVPCQIQTDGSVICAPVDSTEADPTMPVEVRDAFARAAVRILSLYEAAPELRTGEPSAGAVFEASVDFRLAE